MKKIIYYLTPFIIFPAIFLLSTWLEDLDIIKTNILYILVYSVFFLFSALMGSLSPTNKKFDYIMTVIIPLAFFFVLFVGLFFDEGCNGKPQLSLYHALTMEYYYPWLPFVAVITVTTFVTSFKSIRIGKKLHPTDNNENT